MGLFEKINSDIKAAMKAKEKEKLLSLRAIKSELLLAKTQSGDAEITEADELKILKKLLKQRKDSAEVYKKEGRDELAEKEMKEASYIEPYLPEQMGEDEIKAILKEVIEQVGAKAPSDMGKVMGAATKRLAGKADNKLVAQLVRNLLQ